MQSNRITIRLLLFAALSSVWGTLCAQTEAEYAKSLMAERDYFRAISVYKELAFFSHNDDSTVLYLGQVGKAYRLSEKYQLSISSYSDILNRKNLSERVAAPINIGLGLDYLGMHLPDQAIPFFTEASKSDTCAVGRFYLGVAKAEEQDWVGARAVFDSTSRICPGSTISTLSSQFSIQLAGASQISSKSPALAAVFSTIIPGMGQLYCGHYFDALQAFSFVSSFTLASYLAYRYDHKFSPDYILTGVSVSITALFHIANILGAE